MQRPLLYTYRRCPYAMRARMALLWAGVAVDAFEIVLRDKPASMLAASPKGTVPVLVLPDGQVIEQSWDIVAWALTRPGATPDLHALWTAAQSDDNLALLRANDGAFKHHLDRYKYPERFVPAPAEVAGAADVRAHHRQQAVEGLLGPLEDRLSAAPFLGGHAPCATDWALFPFVRQFAAVDRAWFDALPLPHVRAWLAGWLAHPVFIACMAKLTSGQASPWPVHPSSGSALTRPSPGGAPRD